MFSRFFSFNQLEYVNNGSYCVDQYNGKKRFLFKTLTVDVFKDWRSSGDNNHIENVCHPIYRDFISD